MVAEFCIAFSVSPSFSTRSSLSGASSGNLHSSSSFRGRAARISVWETSGKYIFFCGDLDILQPKEIDQSDLPILLFVQLFVLSTIIWSTGLLNFDKYDRVIIPASNANAIAFSPDRRRPRWSIAVSLYPKSRRCRRHQFTICLQRSASAVWRPSAFTRWTWCATTISTVSLKVLYNA